MSKEDFYNLTPDEVMNALERVGFKPTGEFTQLNSYENRVFDVRLEAGSGGVAGRVVSKFYRPGRWSKETILEEHEYLQDAVAAGLPAVAPLKLQSGSTLAIDQNIWFAAFPKMQARMMDEFSPADLKRIGRTIARLHNVGEQKKARFRPKLTANDYGIANLQLLESVVAPEVSARYFDAAEMLLEKLASDLDAKRARGFIRIHGDCHRGNILRTDTRDGASEFFFVDFDDSCMGPPVQDFWMLLADSEETDAGKAELDALLEGYDEFRHFDEADLALIPGLRGLRIIHYAAWIARRWEDPSFPRLFPQFTEYNYWASETEALERLARAYT